MPPKPTPSEEVQQLRQATREAHEAMKDLGAMIRQARSLITTLVDDLQKTASDECYQLANHLQTEMNRQAAELNTAVGKARIAIAEQLRVSELEYSPDTGRIMIVYPNRRFNDNVSLPYPNVPPKESSK